MESYNILKFVLPPLPLLVGKKWQGGKQPDSSPLLPQYLCPTDACSPCPLPRYACLPTTCPHLPFHCCPQLIWAQSFSCPMLQGAAMQGAQLGKMVVVCRCFLPFLAPLPLPISTTGWDKAGRNLCTGTAHPWIAGLEQIRNGFGASPCLLQMGVGLLQLGPVGSSCLGAWLSWGWHQIPPLLPGSLSARGGGEELEQMLEGGNCTPVLLSLAETGSLHSCSSQLPSETAWLGKPRGVPD